jgi:undecaprenyl-diphosphatase
MTSGQALFLGALQGVAELFPISSLAQTILVPALLGWSLQRESPEFLSFVVALHLATAIALVIYFWKDWEKVVKALVGSATRGKLVYDEPSKFAWLLIAGTIVVGIFGLVLEKKINRLFADQKMAWIVAAVLVLNGVMMIAADILKRRAAKRAEAVQNDANGDTTSGENRNAEDLTMIEGASIGATQTLALIPGISRSGVTIAAGLLAGLTYEQASRFSFMLATPVIGLAALLKVPELFKPENRDMLGITGASALVAGVCAYLSTRFLMHYFRHNNLAPFGWFCIVWGAFALVMLKH